jgi:hypothetical protein
MKIRSIAALAAAGVLGLAACGGGIDGPSSMSEDDFIEEVGDICSDTERDLDRIDEPATIADLEDAAAEAIEVLTDTRERLGEIVPPADLADDFADFIDNVDDQLDALADLEAAGKDEDEEAANEVSAELGELSQRRSDLADDLGVDECVNDEEPTDTTPPTDPPSADPATTVPPTVTPLTLPVTLPPQTVPPATAPPATVAPTGPLFDVVDLSTIFVAPEGFTLINSDPAAAQSFIDIVASVPELNNGISEMGVGVLVDDTGDAISTIVVGVASTDSMPAQWKDLLCGVEGTLRTSGSGYTGIVCPGAPGTGVSEIFTLTEGDLGLSVATLVAGVPADLVADAFFEANI